MDSRAGTAAALRRSHEVPAAFTDVYRLLSEPVLIYFTRRTYDPDVALELTAETFARAFSARGQFRGRSDPEAEGWVFAIARSLLGRWYRAGVVEQRAVKRLGMQLPQIAPDDFERIERVAEMDTCRADLATALRTLSDDQREAIQRRVIEERPYDDIARLTGASEATVRARVSRALRQLALALGEETS